MRDGALLAVLSSTRQGFSKGDSLIHLLLDILENWPAVHLSEKYSPRPF